MANLQEVFLFTKNFIFIWLVHINFKNDKIKEERERRKQQDEELRKRQVEIEKARQEKIDAEWSERKLDEKEDAVEKNQTSLKARPLNGNFFLILKL